MMLEFLESVTERKSELTLILSQLDRSGFEQPGPGLWPANTCGVSYWLAKNPREFRQLRLAAGMGDKPTPATSILVQTVCTKFLELPGGALDKARSREARPSDRDHGLEARCAVHGFLFLPFFLIFLSICIVFPIFLCCFAN